jgi:hypothetical protein
MLRPRHLDRKKDLDLAENAAPVLNVVEKSRGFFLFYIYYKLKQDRISM